MTAAPTSFDELPGEWQGVIKRLRKENAANRVRMRAAEAELARLTNLESRLIALENQ